MSEASLAAVDRVVALFEHLTPADVERLGEFYTADAFFKDPFNEVHGLAQVQRIFRHMFEALEAPRFVVTSRIAGAGECFLAWDFHFGLRGRALTIRGASHLRFAADGRVAWHRDYWDAAEELYEKLPVLGTLMRWLKKRAGG